MKIIKTEYGYYISGGIPFIGTKRFNERALKYINQDILKDLREDNENNKNENRSNAYICR